MAAFSLYACVQPCDRTLALLSYRETIERECLRLGQPIDIDYLLASCDQSLQVVLLRDSERVIGLFLLTPFIAPLTGDTSLHVLFAYVEPGYNARSYASQALRAYARWLGYPRLSATSMRKGWARVATKYGWVREPESFSIGT